MISRRFLVTAAATAAVVTTLPVSAHAAGTTALDRSLFDPTPERTAAALHLDGPTAGDLGGAMDLTVRASDGTLPTVPGSCEPVAVDAVVTVSPGKVIRVSTTGEGCAHVVDGALQVNAFFRAKEVAFEGYPRRARLVGDGLVAAAQGFLGGQASFSGTFRW